MKLACLLAAVVSIVLAAGAARSGEDKEEVMSLPTLSQAQVRSYEGDEGAAVVASSSEVAGGPGLSGLALSEPSPEPEPTSTPTLAESVATARAVVAVAEVPAATSGTLYGFVTHYGASYDGQVMGCAPHAPYRTGDTSIVAVAPDRYAAWPCGTEFRISGPSGSIRAVRQDSCPGCRGNHLDLSEAGQIAVCGMLDFNCNVTIEVLR